MTGAEEPVQQYTVVEPVDLRAARQLPRVR